MYIDFSIKIACFCKEGKNYVVQCDRPPIIDEDLMIVLIAFVNQEGVLV